MDPNHLTLVVKKKSPHDNKSMKRKHIQHAELVTQGVNESSELRNWPAHKQYYKQHFLFGLSRMSNFLKTKLCDNSLIAFEIV